MTVNATALAANIALTLSGSAAETVTGLTGDLNAGSLTGALSVTTGDASDNGIAITTGSAATSITDNFSSDTVTVNAAALAQNTVLTLAGAAAQTVTGLVGNINAGSMTGVLSVTTGNATDDNITITTGSGATSISANGASDTVAVNATALAQNTALTLSGSAAETRHRPGRQHQRRRADRGALRDHGRCDRQRHRHHHRFGGDLDHR